MARRVRLDLNQKILAANDRAAAANRERFRRAGVRVVELLGSPGAGKTALLEALLPRLAARGARLAVIEGDQATSRDAARIRALGVPVVQLNTADGCHLDAAQVGGALDRLPPEFINHQETRRARGKTQPRFLPGKIGVPGALVVDLFPIRFLFIENVGNLICPAAFDLGAAKRLAVLSLPEGDDKVAKYPTLFSRVDAVALNKLDLQPYLDFDAARVRSDLRRLAPRTRLFPLSAKTGEGIEELTAWLIGHTKKARGRA